MIAVFALMCSFEVPDACREVMLPAPPDVTEPCGQAARDFATGWARAHPVKLLVDNVACHEAEAPPLEEVAPGIYVHFGEIGLATPENRGDIANVAFVIGDDSVAAIDSGGSRAVGERALAALRQLTDKPLSHVFLGHMHPDHVYGASVFAEVGARIVAHPALGAALANRAESYRRTANEFIGVEGFLGSVLPEIDATVDAATEFELGRRILRALPRETAHTDNDLVVIEETTGTLFASDLVFVDHVPTLDGSLRGWQRVLAELADLDAQRIVPGHGPVVDFPDGLDATARYLDVLAQDARAELDAGASLTEAAPRIGQEEASRWRLFEEFNIRNATSAYVELEWE